MASPLTSGIILKYPIDPTAINPNNKIVDEVHDLGYGINRALVPNYSAFYSESLVVWVEDQVDPLTPNVQYLAAQIHADATASLNREVCLVVVITDPTIMGKVRLEYQTVGGNYSVSIDALRQAIADENLDERTVSWGDLIAKPSAFAPAPHLHDIGDLYGFEYVVEALEALRVSILIGDEATHEEIRQFIRHEDSLLQAAIDASNAALLLHRGDKGNPHSVTKAQVGLGSVGNFGLAVKADMVAGASNILYTTPIRVKEAIDYHAAIPLKAHTDRVDNPHAVTKVQVGLGNVGNYALATKSIMETGNSNTYYATPLRVKEAIDHHALIPLTTHTNRVDNPHAVTKAQVGLSVVENYGVSGEVDARTGTNNTLYMTPLRTSQAVFTQAVTPLNTHIARVNNPHAVTKAQVGLGNVSNLPLATKAIMEGGVSVGHYVTPIRVKEAIDHHALIPLTAHTNRVDNPHAVTKAQVGLGNVSNLPLATKAIMEGGVSVGHYVTPLQVKEAINYHALIPLTAHTNRVDNPHAVTKAQLGLGSVENYGITNESDARVGTSNVTYMTPLRTSQAINTQALTPLNAHVGRTNNPHSVTKAQVGLGSVENYTLSSEAEARAGASNLKYMTPLRVGQAIETLALVPLNAHIARTNNPHAVTKAQVGLSVVENYTIASQAQSEVGTVNNVYMTPLRTSQAITKLALGPLEAHKALTNNPHAVTKAQVGLSDIPNAITSSRSSNTDESLLTAKGMFDHAASADHDARYAPKNTAGVDCSVRVNGANVYVWAAGAWRHVFPPQWQ